MIGTNDLMPGNWVNTKDLGIVKVCSIWNRNINFSNRWRDYDIDYICPKGIPVTPELLEKIGFKMQEDLVLGGNDWVIQLDVLKCYVTDVNQDSRESLRVGKRWFIHILQKNTIKSFGSGFFDSLHELQNLVRVITGYDLSITKEMLE